LKTDMPREFVAVKHAFWHISLHERHCPMTPFWLDH